MLYGCNRKYISFWRVVKRRCYLGFSRSPLGSPPSAEHAIGRATTARFHRPLFVSFDTRRRFSSVRTIDKTMSDGQDRGLQQPKTRSSSAPPLPSGNRPRRGRGESRGRSDDRRRAFRSALTTGARTTTSVVTLDCVLRKGAQSNWSGKQARICVLCDAFCPTHSAATSQRHAPAPRQRCLFLKTNSHSDSGRPACKRRADGHRR